MRNINSCYFGIRQSEYGKTYSDNLLPRCNSSCPVFDLKYVVDTLLQQQRELCTYQCLNNGSDDLVEALKAQNRSHPPSPVPPPIELQQQELLAATWQKSMTTTSIQQNFVLNTPAVDIVLIAGSDAIAEGTWRFQRTGELVPILDWCPGQPDNLREEDCLNLWKQYGGKMNDLPCGFRSSQDRFMCELRNLY
ncbi:perlucin isoform X1 [Biomphalaria glabrata]|nr:perlucin isoform X1 [Biomphalaria glabrata]